MLIDYMLFTCIFVKFKYAIFEILDFPRRPSNLALVWQLEIEISIKYYLLSQKAR